MPIVLDGRVQEDTIKMLNKDIDKILKDINVKDIFYAFYKDDSLYIIKYSDLE